MLDSLRNNISNENRVLKHESEILYLHYFFFFLFKQSFLDSPNWAMGFPKLWIYLI